MHFLTTMKSSKSLVWVNSYASPIGIKYNNCFLNWLCRCSSLMWTQCSVTCLGLSLSQKWTWSKQTGRFCSLFLSGVLYSDESWWRIENVSAEMVCGHRQGEEKTKGAGKPNPFLFINKRLLHISLSAKLTYIYIENSKVFPLLAASQHGKCFLLPLEHCHRYALKRPLIVS